MDIIYTQSMSRLSEKLLAVTLMLVLVVSPLQGAMAGIAADFSVQADDMHQMMHSPESATMDGHQMAHECEHCKGDANCPMDNCTAVQCASCVPALLSSFSLPFNHQREALRLPQLDGRIISAESSSLYRPPRA